MYVINITILIYFLETDPFFNLILNVACARDCVNLRIFCLGLGCIRVLFVYLYFYMLVPFRGNWEYSHFLLVSQWRSI